MPAPQYDADYIRRRYDAYADREWERFDCNPRNRVNFFVHRYYLQQYVRRGDAVLDIGAGPGRFTIELAKLGARITVGDISPVQLTLNRLRVSEAGHEENVIARAVMDITDLSAFPDACFDVVVCYGGPLSYVFEHADQAVVELLRVTRPGGYLFVSVMSLLGSFREFLSEVVRVVHDHGATPVQRLIDTGDQYEDAVSGGHLFHYYRWDELRTLLEHHHCEVVAASASNFLAVEHDDLLATAVEEPSVWDALLRWELEFCRQPGALDSGTHIIAVARRL